MCTTLQNSEIFANRRAIDWNHCEETGRDFIQYGSMISGVWSFAGKTETPTTSKS